ncbi:MAG: hypothetical protein ABIB43_01880 [archaeon]
MLEDKLKKDLNGKYIVYEFEESTIDNEGSELLFYKVSWPNAKEVFGLSNYGELNYENNDERIEILKKKGVKEVVTLNHYSGEFLGISLGITADEDFEAEHEGECWWELRPVYEHDDSHQQLIDHGIKVLHYNITKAEFELQ